MRDVADDGEFFAGRRDRVEPGDFDGRRGASLEDRLALVVKQRADSAEAVSAHDHVPDLERAILHKHRGDHAAALGDGCFEARPLRRALRVGLEPVLALQLGHDLEHLEQLGNALARKRRRFHDGRVTLVFLGHEFLLGELAKDLVDVDIRQVDLVERHDDRDFSRLRMRDRFLRLRHDAVIGRDDQDDDVRDVRPSGAHRGECLVARGINEG